MNGLMMMRAGVAVVVGVGLGTSGLWTSRAESAPAVTAAPDKAAAPRTATVHFTYQRQEVKACKLATVEGQKQCTPTLSPVAKETQVTLSPKSKSGQKATDGRVDIDVTFQKQTEKQSMDVVLPAGNWSLSWTVAGSRLTEQFFVVPSDDFDASLELVEGACRVAGNACVVDAGKRSRSIEIPDERLTQ